MLRRVCAAALLIAAAGCAGDSAGPEPVATVTVTPATITIFTGTTSQLAATAQGTTGAALTGRTITWNSSNPAVASVSASGLVSGVAAGGPVSITATSEGQWGSAQVMVLAPVATLTVAPAAVTLAPGATSQLVATLKDASGNVLTDRTVAWNSSNGAIAAVSLTGLVTGVAVGGPVTITATSEDRSGSSQVKVQVPVASVSVGPANLTLAPGATSQLTATPKDAAGNSLVGRAVAWASSNNAVASVSTSGLVTALSPGGPVTITATSEEVAGSAQVTVQALVATLTVEPASVTLAPGATILLIATPRDAAGNALVGRAVQWVSTNVAVAWVDEIGVAHAVAAGGPVTIMARCEGVSGTAQVTVQAPVATVTVEPANLTLVRDETSQLTATPRDAAGNPLVGRAVAWTSGNNAVATVSPTGLVTALSPGGPVTITATSEGKSGAAVVTVQEPVPGPAVSLTDMRMLTTPAVMKYDGGGYLYYSGVITNRSGGPLSPALIQHWVVQGAAKRAAGGSVFSPCYAGGPFGVIPRGSCAFDEAAVAPGPWSAGTGTLVAGPATLLVEVKLGESGSSPDNLVTYSFPITLTF